MQSLSTVVLRDWRFEVQIANVQSLSTIERLANVQSRVTFWATVDVNLLLTDHIMSSFAHFHRIEAQYYESPLYSHTVSTPDDIYTPCMSSVIINFSLVNFDDFQFDGRCFMQVSSLSIHTMTFMNLLNGVELEALANEVKKALSSCS